MYHIKLKLFGIFKKNLENDFIELNLKNEVSLIEFKNIVRNFFIINNEYEKIEATEESVFATENEILTENFTINKDMTLAILPPVCGG